MHSNLTEVYIEISEIYQIVSDPDVTADELSAAARRFEQISSMLTRPLLLTSITPEGIADNNVRAFVRWLVRASSAETSEDLSDCLSRAHMSLKIAAEIAYWSAITRPTRDF